MHSSFRAFCQHTMFHKKLRGRRLVLFFQTEGKCMLEIKLESLSEVRRIQWKVLFRLLKNVMGDNLLQSSTSLCQTHQSFVLYFFFLSFFLSFYFSFSYSPNLSFSYLFSLSIFFFLSFFVFVLLC